MSKLTIQFPVPKADFVFDPFMYGLDCITMITMTLGPDPLPAVGEVSLGAVNHWRPLDQAKTLSVTSPKLTLMDSTCCWSSQDSGGEMIQGDNSTGHLLNLSITLFGTINDCIDSKYGPPFVPCGCSSTT